MKRILSGIALLLLLSACDIEDAATRARKQDVLGTVVDKGVADLPGKPGYQVHAYTNAREGSPFHFLYVIEQNGKPVAGAANTQPNGKMLESITVQVAGQGTTPTQIHCATIADCKQQLAKLETAEQQDFQKYQELKQRFEPNKN